MIIENNSEIYDPVTKKFACLACGRQYIHRASLWKHKKYECGLEPQYICVYCDYKSATKGNLKRHVFRCLKKKNDLKNL